MIRCTLSSKFPVAYVNVRALTHATEDIEKVLEAVRNILPAELAEEAVLQRKVLKGHYGNPIVSLETRTEKRTVIETVLEKLATGLSSQDKQVLYDEIDQRLEKGDFFIRLDKQSAYLNELQLRTEDPIRLRIHFRTSNSEEILKILRRFGMLL